ncbi:Transcription initiation factor TFIID subunit 2 [Sporothrix stenoceras]|uniref:Transcription initiation factor TFIID subunit 2 n=1 Tax=Sporothrix stenoceras TaxID=5173 RepID=A0ABR3YXL6_9PEZI
MPGILQTDGVNGVAPGSDPSQDPTSDDNLPPLEEFVVVNQEVSIDINFREQSVQGESRITIYLTNPDDPPDEVAFDARQCEIDTTQIHVNGKSVRATYRDPYESLDLPPSWDLTSSNFPVLKSRMRSLLPKRRRDLPVEKREQVGCNPADRSLRVRLRPEPPKPANAAPGTAADSGSAQQPGKLKVRLSTVGLTDTTTNGSDSKMDSDQPTDGLFEIVIPFKTIHIRDGLHFVGVEDSDTRFPHVYTRHSPEPGIAACIFPCLDDPGSRCFWKIHIKTPRTLGDALMQQLASNQSMNDAAAAAADAAASNDRSITVNGNQNKQQAPSQNGQGAKNGHRQLQLTEEDKLLDMTVVCSGNLVGEKVDEADESKKIMTFEITDHGAAANQIGFAVGPFEHVDLYTGFRTDEDDEKLGASALKIHGYCLPGRQVEVQNTCVSLTTAADEFAMTYGRYPYDSFKLCFVDDMVSDTTPLLSFSLCSTRLLFPDSIVERDFDVTRKLVHSLAYQYFGSYIVPNQRAEMWLTVGIAYYMTDLFLCKLCGNNDYRFRIKTMSDRLAEEDRDRPSLHELGTYTYLGDFEMEFMALKAPLVLFILDKRLTKAAGSASASLARVISKIISKANTSGWGDNNNEIISSESFRRVCEKTSQYQLEAFWNQWVLGSGCPWLTIKQRFNRKRLCVEIGIHQTQETAAAKPRPMHHAEFWRELVEKRHGTYTRKVQRLFTGPMTIRIHEANGTPYEHIVEIRDDAAFTGGAKFDIPYNTKYKRLKRNRRNREKAAALAANNADNNNSGGANAENNDDLIVFSLGDKLDTPDEMAAWGLIDWTEQDEKSMDQESYEWIRIDSDFEWISKIHTNMPAWMYLSQLQQDRDIVAQQDTLLYLSRIREHAMSATILTRTLYDDRYFHGLRTMAAENLTRQVWKLSDTAGGNGNDDENGNGAGGQANGTGNESIVYRGLEQLMHVFRKFHCYEDATSKPNDFTDMRRYWVQCAVIDAISKVHFEDKRPREAQRFLLDILRFNNNAQNLFSDHLYVARVIVALATSFCNTSSAATQTGANNNNNGAGNKQRDRGKMDIVLTFDDGMSDDDDASDDFNNLGADIDRMEVDTEDQQLLEAALAEIERYRRMDEWTSSYQNAWTTAALEAKRKLMKTGVIPVDALEFVRYLQDGTIDTVQLKAFEALIDLGLMLRPVILKLLLSTMTTHTSPFMRDQLFKLFSKGLASIAFGEHTGSSSATSADDKKKDQAAITNGTNGGADSTETGEKVKKEDDDDEDDDDTGGLIIEQGDSITKKHQEEHARRENIDAAVAALREAVKGNQELLSAMWDAVLSPVTGCSEKRNLLDLLEVMFDGDLSLLLTVKHPTMWTATRKATPGGVIDFKKVPRPLKAKPAPVPIAAAQPVLGVDPPLATASSVTLPPLSTSAPTSTAPGSAAAPALASNVATPVRTALPGAPAKKPTMPKIKLQTSRISFGGAGSPAPSPAVGTPIVIKKPSVATPAPAAAPATPAPTRALAQAPAAQSSSSSVLPSLTKRERESTADSISVQPAQRKSSVAATPSAAAAAAAAAGKAKSPTPANDYFGNFTSRMGKTPQPAASPAVSVASSVNNNNNNHKRKRQDSHTSFDSSGAPSGGQRPRKLVKIAVPLSYQHKLSPRASHWLETYRTPTPTNNNDGDSIRAAGFVSPTKKASTPHSTSSSKHSGHHRGSATPGPHHNNHRPLPSSKPPRGLTPTPASSSKAGSPVKRESATPDASFKPARKPLPGTVSAASPAVQAPPPPPKAATPAPSTPAATPASKPIFIKFKSKTSNQ